MFYNEFCYVFQKPKFLQWILHRAVGSHFETFLAPGGASGRAEPSRAEPGRDGPSRAEASRAEPSPSRGEPSRAEPSRAEPSRAGPSRAEPRWPHHPYTFPFFAPPGRAQIQLVLVYRINDRLSHHKTCLGSKHTHHYFYSFCLFFLVVPGLFLNLLCFLIPG